MSGLPDADLNIASRALARGDALGALNYVALRDDAPALALRGIAMAQLNDLARARHLLRRAARAFPQREAASRARCELAEAEIALAARDLDGSAKRLDAAAAALERAGDRANAAHARALSIRRLVLIGRLDDAERRIAGFDASPLPAPSRAAYELARFGVATRRLRVAAARDALHQAEVVARATGIAALVSEVEAAASQLHAPAARLLARGEERPLRLAEVEALFASPTLVIDACRLTVRRGDVAIPLGARPVLFALARALAEAWPGAASRSDLLARAFRAKHVDESHRARLRVEIGRLRKALAGLADITAKAAGFALVAPGAVAVLAPPSEGAHAHLLALLADGEAWSSSALAQALSVSPRTIQRELEALAAEGQAQPVGRGRARRWMAPARFPTSLLLPLQSPLG